MVLQFRLVTYMSDDAEANDIADKSSGGDKKNMSIAWRFRNSLSNECSVSIARTSVAIATIELSIDRGFRFYHRQEIKDLLAYLRLLYNPADDVAFLRSVNTPTRGLGDKTIAKIRELANERGLPMLSALRLMVRTW